jgi:hypothetical protein
MHLLGSMKEIYAYFNTEFFRDKPNRHKANIEMDETVNF